MPVGLNEADEPPPARAGPGEVGEVVPLDALPQRPLPRAGRTISPLVWRIDGPPPEAGSARAAAVARAFGAAEWCYVPSGLTDELVRRWADFAAPIGGGAGVGVRVIAGVRVDELLARDAAPLRRRLAHGPGRCEAVMLEEADPLELKNGRPYQRLNRLRDAGVARLIFLEAPDAATAEWLVENTAAHAVSVPLGLEDLTALYGLPQLAAEVGTALLARKPEAATWRPSGQADDAADLAFRLGEPRVAAAIAPMVADGAGLDRVLRVAGPDAADGAGAVVGCVPGTGPEAAEEPDGSPAGIRCVRGIWGGACRTIGVPALKGAS